MVLLRPLAPDASGVPTAITAPDTLDPAILPASSSGVPVYTAVGATHTIAALQQEYAPLDLVNDGELISDGELVFA